jgi:hypothetical protein
VSLFRPSLPQTKDPKDKTLKKDKKEKKEKKTSKSKSKAADDAIAGVLAEVLNGWSIAPLIH